jgi:hypothetical protein
LVVGASCAPPGLEVGQAHLVKDVDEAVIVEVGSRRKELASHPWVQIVGNQRAWVAQERGGQSQSE